MAERRSADVVVVGAGICGSAAAAALAGRGASVLVVDKEPAPAGEQSGRAQGSIRVQGREPAELPLAKESLHLWRKVDDRDAIELRFSGNLYICTSEDELAVVDRLVERAHGQGLMRVQRLDPEEARTVLPPARGPFAGAMWSEEDAQCHPALATAYYATLAERRGATFLFGTTARQVVERDGAVVGLALDDRTIETRAVLIAGGIWTPYLAASIAVPVPLMPLALSQAETAATDVAIPPTLRAFGFGARQRPTGKLSISAGMNTIVDHYLTLASLRQPRTWLPRIARHRRDVRLRVDAPTLRRQLRSRSTTGGRLIRGAIERAANARLMDRSLDVMAQVIPDLRGLPIERYWTGTIDMSPDGLPIIDHREGPDGLVLIAGLSGHGLALGPVLGEIAADLLLDHSTSRPIEPFALKRFEGRTPIPAKML